MTYLLDTNILLRLIDAKSLEHDVVKRALVNIYQAEDVAVIVPQNIIELWAVASRPTSANGLGFTLERTRTEIDDLLERYNLLSDQESLFGVWLELVTVHQVSGKQVHDTKLVAAMMTHGIENILTINTPDFKRFTQVNAVHPLEVNT